MRIVTASVSFALLWLVLAGESSVSELVAAAVAGAVAGGAVGLARARRAAPSGHAKGASLVSVKRVPYQIVRDFAKLAVAALRPGRTVDGLREVPRPKGPGGLVALARSVAPNEIVVAVDDERKRLLVHRLLP